MLRWFWKVWKDNSCGQPSQRHWQSSWFLSISLRRHPSTFIKWDDDFEGFLAYRLFWMLGSHLFFFPKKDPSAAEATWEKSKILFRHVDVFEYVVPKPQLASPVSNIVEWWEAVGPVLWVPYCIEDILDVEFWWMCMAPAELLGCDTP